MPSAPSLTATGAAVLGLLSVRAWTAYDLAQQSRRSLRFVLPRAESVIYSEPKRLVAAGWASSRTEADGRRQRHVYEITADGRRALAAWLSAPSAEPAVVVEPMVRLLFADSGDLDDVRHALDVLGRWAADRQEEGVKICRQYLSGDAPFPDRLHLSALFAEYYAGIYEHTRAFVAAALAEIDTWPATDAVGITPGTRAMLEGIVMRAEPGGGSAPGPA